MSRTDTMISITHSTGFWPTFRIDDQSVEAPCSLVLTFGDLWRSSTSHHITIWQSFWVWCDTLVPNHHWGRRGQSHSKRLVVSIRHSGVPQKSGPRTLVETLRPFVWSQSYYTLPCTDAPSDCPGWSERQKNSRISNSVKNFTGMEVWSTHGPICML